MIGIDEAGRGPLAGPVVAAAVSLRTTHFSSKIGDSKSLTPAQRERACGEIWEKADVGIGVISETVIDRLNILQATFFAMANAVNQLTARLPEDSRPIAGDPGNVLLLVDGNLFRSELPYAYQTIVKGDSLSMSIACASIVAKVYRDRVLQAYDRIFPQYGFALHKGYPTLKHRAAIKQHGLSLIHRRSFQFA